MRHSRICSDPATKKDKMIEMKSKEIEISPISKQHITKVQAFLENGFGRGVGTRWLTKHLKQPLSLRVNAPVGVVAWRENRLVGHFGAVFWHLSTPAGTIVAACPGDLLIASELQHTALAGRIYARMWDQLFKQMKLQGASICIGFGNRLSMRLHARFAGGQIQKMRHVLVWRSLPKIPIVLQRIFWSAWWGLYSGNYQGLTVETQPPDKRDLDNVWAACSLRQENAAYQRDATYLQYRYGNCSYHVWGIRSPEKLLGFVVWDQQDRIIAIKDILAVRAELTRPILVAVLRKILTRAYKSGTHFIKIRLLEDPTLGNLFTLGFRVVNEPILWATRACNMKGEDFTHLMTNSKWYFTMGDVDQW